MKKILYSAMAMILMASCSNAEDLLGLGTQESGNEVDVTACKIAPTRVSYAEADANVTAAWEESDAISLFAYQGDAVNRGTLKFSAYPNAADKTVANFTGRLEKDVNAATTVYAYALYPNVYNTKEGIVNDFHFQTGTLTGEGSATTHDVLYGNATYDPESKEAVKVTFNRKMSLVKFVLSLPAEAASQSDLSVNKCLIQASGLYDKVTLNIKDASLKSSTEGNITIDGAGVSVADGKATFYAAVYPGEVKDATITLGIGSRKYLVQAGDVKTVAGGFQTVNVTADKFAAIKYDVQGLVTDQNGKPMEGVVVSDSYTCVKTDAEGRYGFDRNPSAKFVYYTVPADCAIPTHSEADRTACVYKALDANVYKYDFRLTKLAGGKETNYKMIVIGDPQVTNAFNPYFTSADDNQINVSDVQRFTQETMADIKKTIEALPAGTPVYGLSMGDDVQYTDGYNASLEGQIRKALGSSRMILFSVIGNHDQDGNPTYKAKWEENFGPTDYSFDRGDVHYVCFNNVQFYDRATYYQPGELTDEQMQWLKQDLSYVDKSKKVVLNYHIPLTFGNRSKPGAESLGLSSEPGHFSSSRLATVMELLKQFQGGYELFCGHTHFAINHEIDYGGQHILEHCHAAACGDIWQSNINICGTPNGYYVYTFNGTQLKNGYYKGTNWDADQQMSLFRADTDFNGESYAADWSLATGKNVLVANVFNADSRWKVYAVENGQRHQMTRINTQGQDAFATGYHHKYAKANHYNFFSKRNGYLIMNHLYYYTPQNANATITVEAQDPYGNTYKSTSASVVTEPFFNYAHSYAK